LQTHSPCQYRAAFSSSSAFCAADFFFPKMFKLVVETVVEGTLVTGATGLKAEVGFTAANSMKREQMNVSREFMFDDFC
jgi:hypothetical protein